MRTDGLSLDLNTGVDASIYQKLLFASSVLLRNKNVNAIGSP